MRISSLVAGALCVLGLAACSDSASNSTSADVSPAAGTYSLKSVDGQPLPWTNPDHTDYTLTSLTMTINADGSWVDNVTYSNGVSGHDNGTVSISGSAADFTWTDGKHYHATFSSGTITLTSGGHVNVFQSF